MSEDMARTGRPRQFDKDAALGQALDVFWSRGYGATSVQDLVDALHLERGSLYAAYGDKRRFYLDAVKLYWDTYERDLTRALASGPVLPALRDVLANPILLRAAAQDRDAPHGCMLGNAAVELVPSDPEARAVVDHAFSRFKAIVTDALRRAQATGEVTDASTPEAQAQLLLFIAQGFSLVSRVGVDAEIAQAAAAAALDGLRA